MRKYKGCLGGASVRALKEATSQCAGDAGLPSSAEPVNAASDKNDPSLPSNEDGDVGGVAGTTWPP